MMSPTIVVGADGEVRLVVGSGGSKRIRSAIVQVATSVLDFGHDLETAVRAPRVHWDGQRLQLEPGLSDETLDRNAEAYRKIRNTFRYLLGNLKGFDPQADRLEYDALEEIDGSVEERKFVAANEALKDVTGKAEVLDSLMAEITVERTSFEKRRKTRTIDG